MFLNMLTIEERSAFAELAEKMIQADGIEIGRETAALAALKAEMGITGGVADDRSLAELAGVFANKRSKIAALLELMGLGYSDTSYSVGEESLITSVASEMGVSPEELAEVEAWVKDHVALIRRAMVLMRD